MNLALFPVFLNLSGFLRKRPFFGHPPRKRPHHLPPMAITGTRRYSNTPENRAKRKFLTADFVSNLLTSESILIQPSAVHIRSRHYYIDGHVPLWATSNVLSLLIPGSSWSFGNHPGWHVGCLGRRPLSVSVAAGSPIYPSDGNYSSASSAKNYTYDKAASPPTRQYHRYLSNLKNIPNNDYLVGNGCLREGLQSPYIPIDGSSSSPLTTLTGFKVLTVSEAQSPPRTLALIY